MDLTCHALPELLALGVANAPTVPTPHSPSGERIDWATMFDEKRAGLGPDVVYLLGVGAGIHAEEAFVDLDNVAVGDLSDSDLDRFLPRPVLRWLDASASVDPHIAERWVSRYLVCANQLAARVRAGVVPAPLRPADEIALRNACEQAHVWVEFVGHDDGDPVLGDLVEGDDVDGERLHGAIDTAVDGLMVVGTLRLFDPAFHAMSPEQLSFLMAGKPLHPLNWFESFGSHVGDLVAGERCDAPIAW